MTSTDDPGGPDAPPGPQTNSEAAPAPDPSKQQQVTRPENGDNVAPPPKAQSVCGVCEAAASKYKCSRCYLPYCSVACNKAHQANHPPDAESKTTSEPVSAASIQRPSEPTGPPHPFQVLENSDKLMWLFRKYPGLPQQLLDIHSATQPPPEDPSKRIPASLMKGVPNNRNWTQEKGIDRGKAALRRARRLPGEAGEGIREYCTLIMLLLGEEETKNGTATELQKEMAQRDVDMIRQLIEEEQGRS
ncbi:hypothetical protein HIM_09474 [Hirsutella minnesotensis 3608]|uniref:HIT-type domain-containing protein n=1 Tax=Hirsutella minnesotensis 3608 TaxID=1043627 RepID=A0A0F7ZLF2_9HYPO|nr:hypothetical protein HIM_09474 [Hirsutella minnesotensis 3608]